MADQECAERPLYSARSVVQGPVLMRPSVESESEGGVAVPLHVRWPMRVDPDQALQALKDVSWFGRPADGPDERPAVRRIAADLELPIHDGSALGPVRKAALIDFGPPQITNGEVVATTSWRSATLAPLFPVFVGELRISASGLSLDGAYVPPFGRLGLVIDATLLHFVAQRTAQAFLARFAGRLAGSS